MLDETDGSVTHWVRCLREGNEKAAQLLWERYFEQLVWLVRPKLVGLSQTAADAEDVALSAFGSFCQAIRVGRFPDINDREDLWKSLVLITSQKSISHRRHMTRSRRGGENLDSGTVLLEELEGMVGSEPTPEQAAIVVDECRRLLRILDQEDPAGEIRNVAIWKLEGFTNAEIAEKLGCTERTVTNHLRLIRLLWQKPETNLTTPNPDL